MTLKLKSTPKAAKFEYTDGSMDVSWTVDASLTDEELLEKLRRIVAFMDAQAGAPALPERTPGLALEMTQMANPPAPAQPAFGWAAPPELPERLKNKVELIPPEEQG